MAELLSVLEVSSDGDYNDYDGTPLGILELSDYHLLENLSMNQIVRVYMANELQARAEYSRRTAFHRELKIYGMK